MSKPQLQQAEALVILSDIKTNAQQQFSTKQKASQQAREGSSSSAAVGERAARTTVEHACSHRRHERRERRDQPAFAIARNYLSHPSHLSHSI